MSKEENIKVLKSLVKASEYYVDMIFDLKLIYSDRIHHFGNTADSFEMKRIMNHLNILTPIDVKPIVKNRIYIVSGMECLMSICIGIADAAVDKIIEQIKTELYATDRLPINEIDVNLISTIYIFKNEKAIYSADFYPYMLGILVQAFQKKNIIRYADCENWFND